ncbi:B3/B4 domain-containing protein [Bacillus mojavensis]|uniref:B3/B4 domain-containing protein n=1 Tax=Bacillus mojavensis TaxID=72360 RepID=UPI002DBF970E|nr:phenylalanine--tRNA ligase beta subunit-related protein [Bacillus mojavensis]MEC1291088.1 phenylalanine--tRNA ligase beta subunit-related protein [Bacillus mojavensis]MEC1614897.1 phenylalanine--tRNA ligase beta subunit-related protein [Bacillus mojavensis]MEC1621886.1 phenylalanine--tRNA ligase beta subunit-related protein [Bacillus mojavensis]MEC1634140.1 phenylalanine--tRNA ligase beta subunit-related protein [Bacillus mojavensis]MEC1657786.1 phenylalanine--tRNA ligase beta subunit-relat
MNKEPVFQIRITEDVRNAFPHLIIFAADIQVGNLKRETEEVMKVLWEKELAQWRGKTKQDVKQTGVIKAYNAFFESIGLQTKKTPPSVQNMIQRFLLKDQLVKYPKINPIVDVLNVAAVQSLIPLGAFDLDKINGEMRLDVSFAGESFLPVNSDNEIRLSTGSLVIRDDSRILSQFCYRDSDYQKITDQSAKIRIMGCRVEGVRDIDVIQAVNETIHILTTLYEDCAMI